MKEEKVTSEKTGNVYDSIETMELIEGTEDEKEVENGKSNR